MILSPSVIVGMIRHPRGSYIVYPLLSMEVATPEKKAQFIGRCHPYATNSASTAVLGRMLLTLHATRPTTYGASRFVQAMSTWSVKTRRAPFRHCGDGRVYSRTTTVMHGMSTFPPPTLM